MTCRKLTVVSLVLLLVLALAPAAFAGEEPRVTGSEAKAEASGLIERVADVSEQDPTTPGAVPSWRGAIAGEPLLVHSRQGVPSEYVFPVIGKDGKVVSLIGVSASSGKWHWYSSTSTVDSFPPVEADEAAGKAEQFMRERGVLAELPAPQARMGADKRIYWFFDVGSRLPVEGLYLPAFSDGEILTGIDSPPAGLNPIRPAEENASRGGAERDSLPSAGLGDMLAAPSQYNIAGVPYHAQETDFWCGPASLEMVFDYWGSDIAQTEIARVANTASGVGCYSDDLLRAAHFSSLSRSVLDSNLKGYTSRKMGYMAAEAGWSIESLYGNRYSDLKNLISGGYPVLILTWYDASHSSGHFRLAKGYNNALDVFLVHDPWYTPPYMGPDVQFNQAFLVDDLWGYSKRWGMVSSPWKVNVTRPGSVSKGQAFEVKATVSYPGTSPLGDQYACTGQYAKIQLGEDYELLDAEESKLLSGIDKTGSSSTVSWRVKAKKNKSNTGDITVSAQGLIEGSSQSYTEYQDYIGSGDRFTTYSPTWYLAEGSTAWGFLTNIGILNPNNEPVTAQITYMTGSGAVDGGEISLPARSQAYVKPDELLGETDFSTRVVSKEGKPIAVDRTMWWQPPTAAVETHCSIGVTAPAKTWYLAEGSSGWGFESWLLVQNPNNREATVTVTYMIEGRGPEKRVKKVPANSRRTYSMVEDIGEADASIKVDSDIPVIPERSMYWHNRRGGHDSIGTTRPSGNYYLAEGTTAWGFTTYVLIQNPTGEQATVDVTYMTGRGPVAHPENPVIMPANSRKTIRVNDHLPGVDFSTRVSSDKNIIAERAMYWDNGTGWAGHDSVGMPEPHATFYLPSGETGGSQNAETWTLVQNPNDRDVNVEVSYLTQSGEDNRTFTDTVPAQSRKTYNLADAYTGKCAGIVVRSLTPGGRIMVERAMYWNNRGAGTNTIGGYTD